MKKLFLSFAAVIACVCAFCAVSFAFETDTSLYQNPYNTDEWTADVQFVADSAGTPYSVYLAFYDANGDVVAAKSVCGKQAAIGKNITHLIADAPEEAVAAKAFCWTVNGAPMSASAERSVPRPKTIKILAIGNSFSDDATQHLYGALKQCGYEKVILGNMYIGGCSLQTHWNNAVSGAKAYAYRKNIAGTWNTTSDTALLTGLKDEKWDIITLQQASGSSGVASTYEPYLSNLVNYINENKTNPNAELAWHMTWAYQQDSTHGDFSKYNKDQMTMYNAIVNCVKTKVVPTGAFSYIIPAGTAVQNARTSYLGDTLTRDGFHLSLYQGRYTASLTWIKTLLGANLDGITYNPSIYEIDENVMKILKESANNAAASPFAVTNSVYTTAPAQPGDDKTDFVEVDWEPVGCAYYISTANPPSKLYTTADNSKYFIASKVFSREELPVGSIIEVDTGYQYRPEGWASLDAAYTGSRPANVTLKRVVVTEQWWQDYNYRAFNVAVQGNSVDITSKVAEVASHFRIYVPKDSTETVEYELLDWLERPCAYYNSSSSSNPSRLYTTADNSKYFIASKIFTKDDLPNGSIIEVDPGYQYRPEGWITLSTANSGSDRPANVTAERVVVSDAWWRNFNYRAFNVAVKGGSTDITAISDEVIGHFRIYVPKK